MQQKQRTPHLTSNPLRAVAVSLSTLGLAALLAGCASGLSREAGTTTPVTSTLHLTGSVHGGQQPVSGSTIQLYTVGTTGLKSASTPLIAATVTTDAGGNFNITGTYSCSSATQVYISASGGNSGAGNNAVLTEVAALGACTGLTPTTFIQINEVTTIAAAYGLQPFAADLTHIGATGSSPTGLVNAFGNAALLANVPTGSSPGVLASGVTVPVAEVNTLANIIASCVNTTGAASTPCTQLFAATGATDTFGAALGIARTPGTTAVRNLYTLNTSTAPFQPSTTTLPSDFSVAVTSTAGGTLATPYGIAIDASGNAYVTNETGLSTAGVSRMSPAGAVIPSGSALPTMYGPQGVAVDRNGNIWIANTASNNVIKLTPFIGNSLISSVYTAGGLNAPTAVALDSAGNAFVTNLNGNSVTGLAANGNALVGSPFVGTTAGNISVPQSIAVDATGNLLITSGSGSIVKLSNAGAQTATFTDNALQAPAAVAVNFASGTIAATGYTTGTTINSALSEFTGAGVPSTVSPVATGTQNASAVATDGTSIWTAISSANGGLQQYTYGAATPAGTYGSLANAVGIALDSSGSIWVTNSTANTVSKFIGLAVPVVTPLAANVGP